MLPFITGVVVGVIVMLIFTDPTDIRTKLRKDKATEQQIHDLLAAYHDEWAKRLDAEALVTQLEAALDQAETDIRQGGGTLYCPRCHSLYPQVQHDACITNPHDWHIRKSADV